MITNMEMIMSTFMTSWFIIGAIAGVWSIFREWGNWSVYDSEEGTNSNSIFSIVFRMALATALGYITMVVVLFEAWEDSQF